MKKLVEMMRINKRGPVRTAIPETAVVFVACSFAILMAGSFAFAQTKPSSGVNQDAAIASDFEQRVASYMKLHQQAQTGLAAPKKTDSAAEIVQRRHELAAKIRALRPQAKQGDIFTPEITGLFQRLIASALNGPDGDKIRKSYEHAEPAAVRHLHLEVNQGYPDGIPLQSMPPSLLLNLPPLPKELEYRFVGKELVLHDIAANLIVDVIPNVTTPEQK
jgi:hypothetical protein